MAHVVGNTKSLGASERHALERLAAKRLNSSELMTVELARKIAKLSEKIALQIGLLIGRDGTIEYVIVGSKDRIYLPDLGRFRVEAGRLRRLRLVVFAAAGTWELSPVETSAMVFGKSTGRKKSRKPVGQSIEQLPKPPSDLITDLEKLRLDSLLYLTVEEGGALGPYSLSYLVPEGGSLRNAVAISGGEDLGELQIDFPSFVFDLESQLQKSRPRSVETGKIGAVLVGAYTGSLREAETSMLELQELARTAGIQILDQIVQRRKSLDPKTVIGKGKVEELVLHCLDLGAELVVIDRELSPGQLRSITNLTELKVIDRSMLILDIFAQRAKSSEGRLQVELAQLRYSLPRLTESDSGLSRLSGGIGGRGPGETKLEIGRRRARDRITDLEKRIDQLASQRGLRRERRQVRGVPVIAIVGYTNAGKSTLLNALTKGSVFVENKLFATLDPSSRRMRFPNEREVIFVDTVGFIRELPKELVAAFRATLEEVGNADLLLHVVDASDASMKQQIEIVLDTLKGLGFDGKPRSLILNKTDLLSEIEKKTLENTTGGLCVSAVTRFGLERLVQTCQEMLLETFRGQDPGRFTEIAAGSDYEDNSQER